MRFLYIYYSRRRLAKSTLVLIPLFGVHYMVFLVKPDQVEAKAELILLYTELFFNSFQVSIAVGNIT